jgi:hypothetical protein
MLRRMSSNRVVLAGALLLAACGAKKGDKHEEPATAVEPAPTPAPPPAPAPTPAPAPAKAEPTAEEAALARQQALEQARTSGILGSPALQQGGAFASLTGTADFSSGLDDKEVLGALLGNEPGEMQGGFGYGRSGFGPGGGGTGWGTIGSGQYGTLGHGSGTGSGYGVGSGRGGMRGSDRAVPQLRIGNAQVSGDLDKNIIRRYVRRSLHKLTYCYEKQLLVDPKLAGTIQTHFVIDANGTTQDVSANGVNTAVADCVADVLRAIQYPKPKDGQPVTVTYPFAVRPSGG